MPGTDTTLIALDWGSTQLRAYRLGDAGAVQELRTSGDGASRISGGATGFEDALRRLAGDWLDSGAPVLGCGMVGSAHGWREAPYVDCPLALDALHQHLVPVVMTGGGTLHLVPGLRDRGAEDGLPDVLRGEETQLAGLLAAQPAASSAGLTVVLPGTHSKWVRLRAGRVDGFATHLTGELFALLREQSVLGRLMVAGAAFDGAGFDRGVAAARQSRDLTRLLFSVRSLGLLGELAPEALESYLSGLLIGAELAAALCTIVPEAPIALVGEPTLGELYRRALALAGREARLHTAPLAADGLWHIARGAGWV
ncbi:MAG: 2-dehydro-3-deoxygalactonokinase [Rubrivivax sp.]